jgi:hypothetical protein
MYHHVGHCLQSEKIIEMAAEKSANSSDGNEKGRKMLFILLFYVMAIHQCS